MERERPITSCPRHGGQKLRVPYTTEDIHAALAHVEIKAEDVQLRLRQLLAAAPNDPPSEGECDRPALKLVNVHHPGSLPPNKRTVVGSIYRSAGILELLAFARQSADTFTMEDVVYGFGNDPVQDPKDPAAILLPSIRLSLETDRFALSIDAMPGSRAHELPAHPSGKRAWALYVERAPIRDPLCPRCA